MLAEAERKEDEERRVDLHRVTPRRRCGLTADTLRRDVGGNAAENTVHARLP